MSIENIKGVPIKDFIPYIINGEQFREVLNYYTGTSLKSSNKLLHLSMNDEEKHKLYSLVNSQEGWYRAQYGINTIKLKATAGVLGLASFNINYNKNYHKKTLEVIRSISEEEEVLLKSVYLKQKVITLSNLENNKINGIVKDRITLYRGIKDLKEGQNIYVASNLESWTSKEKVARRFAGANGYILKKDFLFEDIFAYKKSIFKYNKFKDPRVSKYINIENEYIIEFTDKNCIINLKKGENLIGYNDSYLNDNWY